MSLTYVPGNGLNAFVTTLPPTVSPGPPVVGTGSPEGVVEGNPGTSYTDEATNDLYVKVAGVQKMGWRYAGKAPTGTGGTGTGTGAAAAVFSGDGSPVGVVTPTGEAAFYIQKDSTPPGLQWSWYDGSWH